MSEWQRKTERMRAAGMSGADDADRDAWIRQKKPGRAGYGVSVSDLPLWQRGFGISFPGNGAERYIQPGKRAEREEEGVILLLFFVCRIVCYGYRSFLPSFYKNDFLKRLPVTQMKDNQKLR